MAITLSGTDGISFNSGDSLNGYEEGTWTPTVGLGTIGIATGYYIKMGSVVHLWGAIGDASDSATASSVTVGGIPFSQVNSAGGVFTPYPVGSVAVRRVAPASSDYGVPTACAFDGGTLRFYALRIANISGSTMWEMTHSNFVDGFGRVTFSITYQTS